jgi:phosphoribosylglycinamide formyltransferase 2
MARILLLGSGELGKEFVIAAQRLGQYVIAVDNYANAPAMQVAQESEVINMLDGAALDEVVAKHNPEFIVPEIEAIRTERFYDYEAQGIKVIPSAKAANFTMNRKAIRDLAATQLGLKTAPFAYADSPQALASAAQKIGFPCVIKPLMSSSGKGQSTVRKMEDLDKAWTDAQEGARGDARQVIIEGFINFDYEITLLTVTQNNGRTLFCPPIGHRQEEGDYRESWQPTPMKDAILQEAQEMAAKVTQALGGPGIWGVEFFIAGSKVYFSELSPRPHDTGMVTLAQTQNLNEFELHLRAILGLPIGDITQLQPGATSVILSDKHGTHPEFEGLENITALPYADLRIFGKPTTRPNRRMGVILVSPDPKNTEPQDALELASIARTLAKRVQVKSKDH